MWYVLLKHQLFSKIRKFYISGFSWNSDRSKSGNAKLAGVNGIRLQVLRLRVSAPWSLM